MLLEIRTLNVGEVADVVVVIVVKFRKMVEAAVVVCAIKFALDDVAVMPTLGLTVVEDAVVVVPLLLMDVIAGLGPGRAVVEVSFGVTVEDTIVLLP